MRTFDLAPLHRATVGFDQITDMMDRILQGDSGNQSYPPYNIEKTADDSYRISIAVAGFMLHIDLVREVPEALKPRRIEISTAPKVEQDVIEAEKVN